MCIAIKCSKETQFFGDESQDKSIKFNFEKIGSSSEDNQYVWAQTEYRMYTYYNNIKYYFDKDITDNGWDLDYSLNLRSMQSLNTIKGELTRLSFWN